ncbi:MAG: DUF2948 family protein [Rhizobiaceae bacterium]
MDMLKLAALDTDDLTVISACMQDSVLKTGEISFDQRAKRLILPVNRFAWERNGIRLAIPERRRAILHFDRVMAVRSTGIDRKRPDEVLAVLAIRFEPADAPAGHVEIAFAGGATLRLDVECIEAQLSDMGAAWAAKGKPKHGI